MAELFYLGRVLSNKDDKSPGSLSAKLVAGTNIILEEIDVPPIDGNIVIRISSTGGSGGDLHYLYTQASPSATWTITHNLGKNPSVTVIDSGGTSVVGDVDYPSLNQVIITFSAGFAGVAYLN